MCNAIHIVYTGKLYWLNSFLSRFTRVFLKLLFRSSCPSAFKTTSLIVNVKQAFSSSEGKNGLKLYYKTNHFVTSTYEERLVSGCPPQNVKTCF